MDKMRIPKFENEADEANWAYEHREDLAEAFMNQHRQRKEERDSRLGVGLEKALETKDLVIAPDELNGHSLLSVLREKLTRP
jgi:hypothetical protein